MTDASYERAECGLRGVIVTHEIRPGERVNASNVERRVSLARAHGQVLLPWFD
jgi:hypothetical protein